MANWTRSDASGKARGAGADRKSRRPLHPLDQATHRISASSLDLKGIKNVRVLNESRFLTVLEGMVEERVKARLSDGPVFSLPVNQTGEQVDQTPNPAAAALTAEMVKHAREQYQEQWREFRERFEDKLRRLEERASLLAEDPGEPAQ